jgi:adenosylcobinamide-GDP ribazoletransferase
MLSCLRSEWRHFLLAVGFFTRIPVPEFSDFHEDDLNHSAKYFPLVGVVVGMVGAGAFLLATKTFPNNVAVLLSMATTIYITGAFHEDGLADSADGLGGGWNREQILTIMQDSRLGTYGAVALFLMLFAKFQVLNALPPYFLPFILIVGHALSRLSAVYVMASLPYVKTSGKAKPLAIDVRMADLMLASLLAILPVPFIYLNFSPFILNMADWFWLGLYCLVPMGLAWVWWRNKIKHWLGGYTGDCLGAMQQITEFAFYFGLLAWCQQL